MTAALPVVEVLLATWNGARFLREQIDSVLQQEGVHTTILARDDGSTDETVAILHEYVQHYPDRVRLVEDGVRTGVSSGNFHRLILQSMGKYVAFCDQDDVWLPGKLRLTLDALQALEHRLPADAPLLAYTDLTVTDAALHPTSESLWRSNNIDAAHPAFSSLLAENVVTGCTALINRPLADEMRQLPQEAFLHDHWAALLASSMGGIAPVAQQTILYRQHGANETGAKPPQGIRTQMERLFSRKAMEERAAMDARMRRQAQALLHMYGERMRTEERETTVAFIALPGMPRMQRLRTIVRHRLWRNGIARKITLLNDLLRG